MTIQDITLAQVQHTYHGDVAALRDITLHIGKGVFGLLGPNGAGKTTMMRILATLLPPSEGEIRVGPFSVTDKEDRHRIRTCMGYVPQDDPSYPHLSGREFLEYMAIAKCIGPARLRRREVDRAIDTMGLTNFAHRRIQTYSGGMKRRVAVAQALLGSPQVLIADEPMAGLDPMERMRFRSFVGELSRECIVVVTSHILEDIADMCDVVAVLQHGRLAYAGRPAGLAALAQGFVWELAIGLPYRTDCLVLRTKAGVSHRILAPESPHAEAEPVAATMEDGYFWLIREP